MPTHSRSTTTPAGNPLIGLTFAILWLVATNVAVGQVYIDNVTVIGNSSFQNEWNVKTMNVKGNGTVANVENLAGGSITELFLESGKVVNKGMIVDLTYTGGTFNNEAKGTLNTLILAGNSANNTAGWGVVDTIQFSSNGGGILNISASYDPTGEVIFSGIQANNINLTDGSIVLNLTGFKGDLLTGEGDILNALFDNQVIDLAALLGTSTIIGIESLSLSIDFGSGIPTHIVSNGKLTEDYWDQWKVIVSGSNNPVPEPATLAIIGLGLAGLGLARRRK